MNKEKGIVDYIWVVIQVGPRRELDYERDLKTRHWDVRQPNVHFVSYQKSRLDDELICAKQAREDENVRREQRQPATPM